MAKRKRKPSSTVDRLSALHESILLHILSFLPTKDSIKTSILSKRWRHTWASVPALRLTVNSPGDVDVVDRVLALHSAPSISTFSINVSWNYDLLDSVRGRACSWIDHAAARNVRRMKIDLGQCCLEPKILDRIFRCQFLETLTLKREIKKLAQPPSPLTPFFTNLRTLKLHLVSRPSGSKLTGELISNCCNLQVLCLHAEGFRFLRISAPRLQRLQLGLTGWWTSEVEISCPGLVEFDFRIGHEVEKFRGDMPSLCRASFKTNFPPLCPVWIPIFRSVCNAETLQLFCLDCSEICQQLMGRSHRRRLTFHNLKTLELGSCFHYDSIEFIVYLLENSPRLNFLTILLESTCRCDDKRNRWTSRKFPSNFLDNLMSVSILTGRRRGLINKGELLKFLATNVSEWDSVIKRI